MYNDDNGARRLVWSAAIAAIVIVMGGIAAFGAKAYNNGERISAMEAGQQDVRTRLERIETKLDRLLME